MSSFWKMQNRNLSVVPESGGRNRDRLGKATREFWKVMKLFYLLTVGSYVTLCLPNTKALKRWILHYVSQKKKSKSSSLVWVIGSLCWVSESGLKDPLLFPSGLSYCSHLPSKLRAWLLPFKGWVSVELPREGTVMSQITVLNSRTVAFTLGVYSKKLLEEIH